MNRFKRGSRAWCWLGLDWKSALRAFALLTLAVCFLMTAWYPAANAQEKYRRLPVKEYRDRMKGDWVGQMVGAAWGMTQEFRWNYEIMPEYMVHKWQPAMINDSLTNDDVFSDTQLLFLLDRFGLDITPRRAPLEMALEWGQPPDSQVLAGYAPARHGAGFGARARRSRILFAFREDLNA